MNVDPAAIRSRGNRDAVTWQEIAALCDALDAARADNVHWRTTANVATNNVADWIAAAEPLPACRAHPTRWGQR